MSKSHTFKQYMGALIFDLPIYVSALYLKKKANYTHPWLWIRNRREVLMESQDGEGVKCDWLWTSDLYMPKVFPQIGRWLVNRTLNDYPIHLSDEPSDMGKKPDVSFLIGHRGLERLPLLLMTLKSIAAQTKCNIECVVVEQDNERLIQDKLPEWVRYIHTPLPDKNMPYSRSWAFNVAAREAHADCLIFHDNDMLVPREYASQILKYYRKGYEFINLKRFIFYFTKTHSANILSERRPFLDRSPETIVQNLEAGGSFASDKDAYWEIGGFDERFVGWGGEDNEFWERANTRKVYPYGFLPIIHLWHSPQPEKHNDDKDSQKLHRKLSKIHVADRIQRLRDLE